MSTTAADGTKTPAKTAFGADLYRLMSVWNTITAKARLDFPDASEDEIQRIATGAMRHVCRLPP